MCQSHVIHSATTPSLSTCRLSHVSVTCHSLSDNVTSLNLSSEPSVSHMSLAIHSATSPPLSTCRLSHVSVTCHWPFTQRQRHLSQPARDCQRSQLPPSVGAFQHVMRQPRLWRRYRPVPCGVEVHQSGFLCHHGFSRRTLRCRTVLSYCKRHS